VRWLVRFFLIMIVIGGLAFWWVYRELGAPFYGPASPEIFVTIPKGTGGQSIAQLLEGARR